MRDMQTPLRRVRGLGTARDGTTHFWKVRVSSLALLPLSVLAIGLVLSMSGAGHDEVRATLGQPLVAVPLLLFVVLSVEHMRLGMQEVIADYVHGELTKWTLLVLNSTFCVLVGAVSAFALLRIAFGG